MRKLMLLVLVLLVHESAQQIPFMNDSCADCSSIKSPRFTSIGHICHQEDKTAITKNHTQENSPHSECVPNIYKVTRPVKRYCCFWSPDLGCSMLFGEENNNIHELRCAPCKAYCEPTENNAEHTNYVNLATIPLPLVYLALNKMSTPLN